ncbi:hypothetical protein V5G24_04085 [Xanthobacter sp. VTT E-85241]|uniref:hypothetical protein n=1 Tax=Roseixanthobacter finlandensis TaxID=3119922 RepID=UPI00372C316D
MIIGPRGLADGSPQFRRMSNVNILTHPLGLDAWAAAALGRMQAPPGDFVQRLDAGARIYRADGVLDQLDALWVTGSYSQYSARLNLVPWTGTVTNLLPNGEMVGAAAGAPGTMPTGWASVFMVGGITRQVVGVGTVNGMRYIDVRFSGTPASASGIGIPLSSTNACPGVVGSRMTVSLYLALIGGSLDGTTLTRVNYTEYNASNAAVATDYNVIPALSIALTSTLTRVSGTRVLTGATAAFVVPALEIGHGTGAIDLTLRIGLPQLVRMDVPGNYIPTSGAAASQVQTLARFDLAEMNNPTWAAWAPGAPGGFVGGGTTYLDTVADPSFDFTRASLNSATYGAWVSSETITPNSVLGATVSSIPVVPRSDVNTTYCRVHSNVSLTVPGATTSLGLTVGNRSAANALQLYRNGASIGASAAASSAMTTELWVGRNVGTYYPGQVSAAFAGASMTAAQHLALYRGLAAMLGAAS